MKDIGEIACYIEEEVADACKYAKKALWFKDNGHSLSAQAFYELAQQEVKHAEKLHEVVINLINEKKSEVEIPQGMMDIWEWKHQQLVDKLAHAKEEIALYTR